MDRRITHRKFIVLLKIIHLTDKPVATCTSVIGICLFEIHGLFHKFVKGSYYCGHRVQSFNYLLQKAQDSVVHLTLEKSVQFILSTASSLLSRSLQGHIIYTGNKSLAILLTII